MCNQQSLRSAYAYAQSDQSLCLSLENFMSVKLLAEHLEFLSLKEAAQAGLSLHLSKCHIVGNHMSRLIYRGVEETKLSLAAVNAIVQSGRSGLIKKGKDALDTLKKGKALDWKVILK